MQTRKQMIYREYEHFIFSLISTNQFVQPI